MPMGRIVLALLCFLPFGAALTSLFGPPKLLVEPPKEVWFQPGDEEVASKFSLKCIASENAETYYWHKNGESLEVEGEISWEKPGQSGSILFTRPGPHHVGYYQCFVSNIYGTAVSNRVHVQLGVLEHFPPRPTRIMTVNEGSSLSIPCSPPFGQPSPSIFWLFRDTEQNNVIETIKREHITVDPEGSLHFTSVRAHDGRSNLIYECAASSPVLHGEYRAGDRIQVVVHPSTGFQKPYPVKSLYLSPDHITIKAGSKLKLQCIFGGFPMPRIFWSKERGELPKSRMKDLTTAEADFGKSLVVDNVHPEDAGVYQCRAGTITHKITVDVEAAPYWENLPPDDIELPEADEAELRCLAGGKPAPLVQWTQNGKPLHEAPSTDRYLLLDGGRRLRITKLDHDMDTAVYQCNASNPRGYVYANAFVHVKAYPPRFTMPSNRVLKVVLSSTVDMNCDVDAAPTADVRWVDADDKNIITVPGKSEIHRNNTFRIYEVNTADEGLYYCNVSNKYGINRSTNRLHVYKSTYFTRVPSPKMLTVEAGQRVELECEAVQDERLSISYKWTVDGKEINGDDTAYQISGTKLILPKARGWHSGVIECTVKTDVDVKTANMLLSVKDVPRWPPIESIICHERKATIEWRKPNDHSDPIIRYIVEMNTSFRKKEWSLVTIEKAQAKREVYTVDVTLSPWVNYTFRVAAINSHGRSLKESVPVGTQETASCHTRPSFPYSNPEGVWAEGTAPDNLVIHWKPLDKYDWNAPRLQYLVRYRLKEPDIAWSEFVVEDAYANHTIIREMPTFRKFEVQVRAVNSIGPSIVEPEIVVGYSGEDVPLSSPRHFRIVQIFNFTSANFSWEPVSAEEMRGHTEGYEIEYWPIHDKAKSRVATVKGAVSHFVLNKLRSCTNYTAVVRARNKKYRSAESSPIAFETPEGIPSEVSDAFVASIGSRSILVSWKPPAEPNGVLRGYFLTFTDERNITEETYVLHRQLHYMHEKAIPEMGYKISVWAETGAGEGPKVLKAVKTWPSRAPDRPKFKVMNVTETAARIKWIPSEGFQWRMPGSSFYLRYTNDNTTFIQSAPVFLPSTFLSLEDLSPNARYFIWGVSRDGNFTSTSIEPIEMFTPTTEKPSHLNQESVRNAFWFLAVLVAVAVALIAVLVTCCCEQRRSGRYAVRRKEMEIGHQIDADEERTFLEYQYGYK
ncbi:hypothetical protein PMAYCL1PPCAC_18641 [Pristionchus mayeri]|uniref:Immunoglobulin n=1 Tax=Pristionchus mayeri TaxID=1317129 RepID=A0AAN5CPV2_9BILA|nr:hypothetical protein PMAYCL1PPCAC_18641 [Pristionchus mayeri]